VARTVFIKRKAITPTYYYCTDSMHVSLPAIVSVHSYLSHRS